MTRWVSKFVFTDIFLLHTNNDIAHALFNDIATLYFYYRRPFFNTVKVNIRISLLYKFQHLMFIMKIVKLACYYKNVYFQVKPDKQ